MATIVNNPAPATNNSGSGMGFLLGIIILLVVAVLFFYYGLPYLSAMTRGPQINIPSKVDVNVHNSGK